MPYSANRMAAAASAVRIGREFQRRAMISEVQPTSGTLNPIAARIRRTHRSALVILRLFFICLMMLLLANKVEYINQYFIICEFVIDRNPHSLCSSRVSNRTK